MYLEQTYRSKIEISETISKKKKKKTCCLEILRALYFFVWTILNLHLGPGTNQACCKFGVIQCNITSQNGPAGLDMPMRESPNLVNQLTTPKCLYQTIPQMLAQLLCGYRYVIYTCAASMCCHGVFVQGLHSTGHLQHPTKELAIRVTALTLPRTRMD